MEPAYHPSHSDPTDQAKRAEEKANDPRGRIGGVELQVKELMRQVDYLSAAVVALGELLRDRHGVPAEVMNAKVQEVIQRGSAWRWQAHRCDGCGRVSSSGRTRCLYCDREFPVAPFITERPDGAASNAITTAPGH